MISNEHTLNQIINKKFDKEHFSGVCVSDFYRSTILNELQLNYKDFESIKGSLRHFFELKQLYPFHILTGNYQNHGTIPKTYEPYENKIKQMYKHLVSFVEKYEYGTNPNNNDLIEMFFQEMFFEYIDSINKFNQTIEHITRLKHILGVFKALITMLNNNMDKNEDLRQEVESDVFEIEYYSYTQLRNFGNLTIYDFPLRLVIRTQEYRNAILKLDSQKLDYLIQKYLN